MLAFIDNILNKVTMYKLALYCLSFLWLAGLGFSFFGLISLEPWSLIFSSAIIFSVALTANNIFAYVCKAPSNTESTYITALILTLIAGPENSWSGFLMLAFVSVAAVASKYILAINKKHLFNPSAFGVVASVFLFSYYPSWWIGDAYLMLFVIITGVLIARKIQRTELVAAFLITFVITSSGAIRSAQDVVALFSNLFLYSPILFFSIVMLTEPQTTPPTKKLQIIYGALTAFLITPFFHIGSLYFSPELALVTANIFSYLVSPRQKLILIFKEKIKIADNAFEFIFRSDKKLDFKPGQYLEWTLAHKSQDMRGMRRYFTIASSPTEPDMRLGIKFYPNPSSYKKQLLKLKQGDAVVAAQLSGEFTLPKDATKKLVFLAGGIGITPFRSMIKYLLDTNQKRDIIMFYANQTYQDIAYKEIFDQARKELGINTVYALDDANNCPADFICQQGLVTMEMLKKHVPDLKERVFYISGPRSMIVSFEKTLKQLQIPKSHIKTDFFPGYA